MVRLAALHGGEVGNSGGHCTDDAKAEIQPIDAFVEAFHHQNSDEGGREKSPLHRAHRTLPVEVAGKKYRKNGAEVLDDSGTRNGNITEGVKKGGESNCAEDTSNDEPFPIDSQQTVTVIFEPNSGEKQRYNGSKKDQFLGRKVGEGFYTEICSCIEHSC